jgi:TonB family protein
MEEQILSYLKKELSTEARQVFETALTNDLVLQKEFEMQRELWEKLRLLRLRNKVQDIIEETNARKDAMEADLERQRKEDLEKWERENLEDSPTVLKDDYYYGMHTPTALKPQLFEADFLGAGQIDAPNENTTENKGINYLQFRWLGYSLSLIAILSVLVFPYWLSIKMRSSNLKSFPANTDSLKINNIDTAVRVNSTHIQAESDTKAKIQPTKKPQIELKLKNNLMADTKSTNINPSIPQKADTQSQLTRAVPAPSWLSFAGVMPEFVGGKQKLLDYLNRELRYPVDARKNRVQGTVYVNFIVEEDGTITNVYVVRSLNTDYDKEAIRVIRSMPKWVAGQQNGHPVRVKMTLPIKFSVDY